jgi:hypothetical protein
MPFVDLAAGLYDADHQGACEDNGYIEIGQNELFADRIHAVHRENGTKASKRKVDVVQLLDPFFPSPAREGGGASEQGQEFTASDHEERDGINKNASDDGAEPNQRPGTRERNYHQGNHEQREAKYQPAAVARAFAQEVSRQQHKRQQSNEPLRRVG